MIRRIIVLLAVASVVLGGTATGVLAQPSLNQQDKKFLAQAHRSNLAEILSSKLAEKKSTDTAVRDMARKLVADHTKLDAAVRQTAQKAGVELPQTPGPKQRATLDALSNLSGAAFTRAWITAQIAGHRQTLSNINNELQDGSSAEVKKLASDAKPVVQGHLEALQKMRGAGAGESPSPQGSPSESGMPTGTPSG